VCDNRTIFGGSAGLQPTYPDLDLSIRFFAHLDFLK